MKWRSIFSSCCEVESQSSEVMKVVAANDKPSSFQRISKIDFTNPNSTISEDLSISLAGSDIHVFTLAELKLISQAFSSSNFLGEGGFGPVYKGFLDDNLRPGLLPQPVAIKLLDLDGTQGHREWLVRYPTSIPIQSFQFHSLSLFFNQFNSYSILNVRRRSFF